MAELHVQRHLAAILAADVAGYSRLMALDEEGTLATLNAHRSKLIEPAIDEHRGRIVKTTGDGLLAEFASVVDAVRCAVAIQGGMRERNANAPVDQRIEFRVGINLGDVIAQDGDVYGDGVNIAARLEGLSEPGGICISGTAYDQVHGKIDVGFSDLGEQDVKNIARPIRTYGVRLDGTDALLAEAPAAISTPVWRRWHTVAAIVMLIAAVGAGLLFWEPWVRRVEPASVDRMAFQLPEKPSIAVLPFNDFSEKKDQEYFADGLTEEIISSLASFENIFVIARNSTNIFKGKVTDAREVAEELGVRYVLEGSIRRAGKSLRVTVQLVDAISGRHIWAQKYDREMKDIFAVQDEITAEVSSRLISKVVATEFQRHARRGTKDPEAYHLFLRGWEAIQALSPQANLRAIQLFERALEKDPEFARAYAYLALTRGFNADFGWANGPNDTFSRATELAQKAIALDPKDALTHRVLGQLYRMQGDFERAIEAFEKAIALSPSNSLTMISLAHALAFAGRGEEAISYVETAMRLNPHAPWFYWGFAGRAYYVSKQFDKAATAFDQSRRLNPRFDDNIHWLAASYAQIGKMEEARAAKEELLIRQPGFSIQGQLQQDRLRGAVRELIVDGLRKAGFPEHPH